MEGRYEKRMSLSTALTSIVTVASTIAKEINDNTVLKEVLFGKYADGRARSAVDSVKGEYRSPKQKKKYEEGGKKKHKKNKYKKKYKKLKRRNKKHNKKQKKYSKKYKYTI